MTNVLNSPFFFFCKSYIETHVDRVDVSVPLWWEKVPKKLEKKLHKQWEEMSKDEKKPYILLSHKTSMLEVDDGVEQETARFARLMFRNKYLGVYKKLHPQDESVANLTLGPGDYWSSCPDHVKELANDRWNTMNDKSKEPYIVDAYEVIENMKKMKI